MKKRDLERHLKAQGCYLFKQGSRHEKWINPKNKKKTVVPRHKELNTFTCIAICRQLEIVEIEGK